LNKSNTIISRITISLVSVLTIFSIFLLQQPSSFMTNIQAQVEYDIMMLDNIVNKYENNKNNSNNEQSNISPIQQPQDNNVYVVWLEHPYNRYIFFTASNDTGQTFSTPITLNNNTVFPGYPQIVSEENHVYVVWPDKLFDNYDIFFTASNDTGRTFSTPINISNSTKESFAQQISSEGNNVFVVWIDHTPDNFDYDIFFTASNDTGQTFSTPIDLYNNTGFSLSPKISSEGNSVYVAWVISTFDNDEIFFTASNDTGQTFSTPLNLSNNIGTLTHSGAQQISSEGNNVFVVWNDFEFDNFDELSFTASNDTGRTFSTPINISNSVGFWKSPQIVSEGNSVYVVWNDFTLDNYDIFFTASNDTGRTFSTPINLSYNTGESTNPQISSEGNNVFIVWSDDTPDNFDYDIFFTASNDTGQTFSTPINLSNNTRISTNPQISSEGNNVFIVWMDHTLGPDPLRDIFFAASNDNGQTFSTPINISNDTLSSRYPQISSSIS
jgi:hypothetical protein